MRRPRAQDGPRQGRVVPLLVAALCLGPAGPAETPVTLFLIGDSTMADKPLDDNPERGWGQVLPRFFDVTVTVENHARNGRSTRSFLAEDRWRPVLEKMKPGDYVVIQFGHNDQSREKVDRYTPPDDYRTNLVKFVRETRERGGRPILCTSIVRRRFNDAGEFYDVHGVYPDIVRAVAADLNVPLLDMHRSSMDLVRSLGAEGSKRLFLWIPPGAFSSLPDGKKDDTHFSEWGATQMAELAVQAMRNLNLDIVPRLRGVYTNPVLHADYSDPDIARVGSEYFMVASSFQCVPGLPVLRSGDLVHWELIGHALPALPSPDFSTSRHGEGVWAPSIRWYDGEFRITYGDPDRGIFLVTARDPRGPWNAPVLLRGGKGLIDPCPFRDEDGSWWLVHAWAKSRAGFNGVLTLHRLNEAGTACVDTGRAVFRGGDIHPTIEGPKLYKRGDFYYIFAPAGGVARGWQTVLRARSITGPYEARTVLHQGGTDINGPHQGAWVETGEGSSWFLHFQDAGAYGRITHLQPLYWSAGWPAIGTDPDGDGIGEPVRGYVLPGPSTSAPDDIAAGSDEFDARTLNLHWQWHANPAPDWYSMTAAPGSLRLYALRPSSSGENLWSAPNLLLQKFPAEEFTVTAALHATAEGDAAGAGLVVMGRDYATICVNAGKEGTVVRYLTCADADKGSAERLVAGAPLPAGRVHLRVEVRKGAQCRFSYSTNGAEFTALGETFQARKGAWIGAKVGLFARGPGSGHADVEWFRIER